MSRKGKHQLKKLKPNEGAPSKSGECDTNLIFAGEINKIIVMVQKDLTSHQQFVREMRRIYAEMEHDKFMQIIKNILMFFMQQPEDDLNAKTVLLFVCNLLASYNDDENENPWRSILNFILSTDGSNPHIRFRLCELTNVLLVAVGNATLDEEICDRILNYMLNRLKNSSPHVRAEAIRALERLQNPDDPNDVVVNYFIYHMQADPSAKVREAVISKIARNTRTIPIIIERLLDLEERVRRHTYIEMMKGFPVKSYRIGQRLTFLENGLTDESASIRKIVAHLMITEWLVSYNDNYLAFLCALKLNGSDEELQRYHKTAKCVLREIFKKTKIEQLITALPYKVEGQTPDEPATIESQFCVPIEQLTLEHTVFWVNLAEYIYEERSNDVDLVLPDLTTYCEYVNSYCNFEPANSEKPLEEWQELERGYIITNLVNNLKYFDYSDVVGTKNLNDLVCHLLIKCELLNDHSIKSLLVVLQLIVPNTIDRFSILHTIIHNIYAPDNFEFVSERPILRTILQDACNSNILLTISDLKVQIMEIKEQIEDLLANNDYESVQRSTKVLHHLEMEYNNTLMPLLNCLRDEEAKSIWQAIQTAPSSTIVKCLKILYFTLSSDEVSALTPTIRPFFSDFVRRFTESNQIDVRKWALQCGTTFALLHEQFSHDMFRLLQKQFVMKPNTQIWKVAIRGIFQLLVRYDLKFFNYADMDHNEVTKNLSQSCTHNSSCHCSQDGNDNVVGGVSTENLYSFMLHILDTCTDTVIFNTVIEGFCLLCIHTKPDIYSEIISKLMITYFDPDTNSKANQLLGVFFKKLIAIGKSIVLEAVLLPTINKILDAGPESTLAEINPKNVLRFIINATQLKYCPSELNIHEIMAESFLTEIRLNLKTKPYLVNLLSSELIRLHGCKTSEKKSTFLKTIDEILIENCGSEKITQNLINFQKLLSDELTHTMMAEFSTNQDTDNQFTEITNSMSVTNCREVNLSAEPGNIETVMEHDVGMNLRESINLAASSNADINCPLYGSIFIGTRRSSLRR